jgi:hypothetical protein
MCGCAIRFDSARNMLTVRNNSSMVYLTPSCGKPMADLCAVKKRSRIRLANTSHLRNTPFRCFPDAPAKQQLSTNLLPRYRKCSQLLHFQTPICRFLVHLKDCTWVSMLACRMFPSVFHDDKLLGELSLNVVIPSQGDIHPEKN